MRRARILILDEPTAVLMPQEIADLMVTLRQLAIQGFSIFMVTHKLAEAMQVSDRVSVMRAGLMIGTWNTSDTNPDALITSHDRTWPAHPFGAARDAPAPAHSLSPRVYRARRPRHRCIARSDLTMQPGEILGVAGVEGNGQRELAEAIIGLRPVTNAGRSPGWRKHSRLLATIDICARAWALCRRIGIMMRWCYRCRFPRTPFWSAIATAAFDRRGLLVSDAVAAFASAAGQGISNPLCRRERCRSAVCRAAISRSSSLAGK